MVRRRSPQVLDFGLSEEETSHRIQCLLFMLFSPNRKAAPQTASGPVDENLKLLAAFDLSSSRGSQSRKIKNPKYKCRDTRRSPQKPGRSPPSLWVKLALTLGFSRASGASIGLKATVRQDAIRRASCLNPTDALRQPVL
jgi:hypothetical protein